ncbi:MULTISPECIES: MBL fold metallo-hydrolase [unclassified Shinella]|uniref:MBL fold metallo-hydrolase n=1 Tax=unclassified Shinella TaxID=2643062 RepID=UPI00234F1EFF|nr:MULTISPECIES: MBL fold metallo-hydrolase [unclassified Shinella]MCO5150750.1 MBL fold metallo-hydrolase [Shinella sp.]MDC7263239.1 MBL fold metallo-hydrolase [Shinella sp. HY16]MDC7270134.1 MBL fold metallo-hydrolase [Shinella sp. YZ44]
MPHLLLIPLILVAVAVFAAPRVSFAQAEAPVSQCQMIARSLPSVTFASFSGGAALKVQAKANEEVRITYVGHSTFFIETPAGVKIATDYNGWYKPPALPTVVTMNKAHSSHYTLTPEPGIEYVLHGWLDGSEKGADHDVVAGDTYIRNVPTDIRGWGGAMEPNGNSIFIFEVAGLCIGHLGHLHHELTEKQYAEIGRLDVLMVPVDGGLTIGAESMSRVVQRLRSALILPMHRRGPPISQFLSMFGEGFDAVTDDDATITVSIRNLPKRPTIHILSGV